MNKLFSKGGSSRKYIFKDGVWLNSSILHDLTNVALSGGVLKKDYNVSGCVTLTGFFDDTIVGFKAILTSGNFIPWNRLSIGISGGCQSSGTIQTQDSKYGIEHTLVALCGVGSTVTLGASYSNEQSISVPSNNSLSAWEISEIWTEKIGGGN